MHRCSFAVTQKLAGKKRSKSSVLAVNQFFSRVFLPNEIFTFVRPERQLKANSVEREAKQTVNSRSRSFGQNKRK